MSGSTVANALLILTIIIASEVSSAPREKMVQQDPGREKFAETREAEVRHSLINEDIRTREDEVRQRQTRVAVREPLPSPNESNGVATTKPSAVRENVTSEVDDMSRTSETPQDDHAKSNETLTDQETKITNTKTPSTIDKPTGNAATVPPLPPMIFPDSEARELNPSNEADRYISHAESPGTTSNKSNANETRVEIVPMTTTTTMISSTVSTATVATESPTEKPTTTSSTTTSPTVPTKVTVASTSTTTTPSTTTPPTVPTKVTVASTSTTTENVITVSATIVASTEPSKAELQLHSKKATRMPSGVVALITAIAFAIVAVMAYVGLVAWRRYLEWRYGNRELLVNDFDANDIGNFEL